MSTTSTCNASTAYVQVISPTYELGLSLSDDDSFYVKSLAMIVKLSFLLKT